MNIVCALGANKNALKDDRWTPLHLAAENDNEEVVRVLAAAGGKDSSPQTYNRVNALCLLRF